LEIWQSKNNSRLMVLCNEGMETEEPSRIRADVAAMSDCDDSNDELAEPNELALVNLLSVSANSSKFTPVRPALLNFCK
jgi:hypothetical protein